MRKHRISTALPGVIILLETFAGIRILSVCCTHCYPSDFLFRMVDSFCLCFLSHPHLRLLHLPAPPPWGFLQVVLPQPAVRQLGNAKWINALGATLSYFRQKSVHTFPSFQSLKKDNSQRCTMYLWVPMKFNSISPWYQPTQLYTMAFYALSLAPKLIFSLFTAEN